MDLAAATGQPTKIFWKGKEYNIHPLTIGKMGEFVAKFKKLAIKDFLDLIATCDTDEEKDFWRHKLEESLESSKYDWGHKSGKCQEFLQTVQGMLTLTEILMNEDRSIIEKMILDPEFQVQFRGVITSSLGVVKEAELGGSEDASKDGSKKKS